MAGRVYDDKPESVWDFEADTYRAERDWADEPNVVAAGAGRGDAATSEWDRVAPVVAIEADDFARAMWGGAA